jgi:hypothetical protein
MYKIITEPNKEWLVDKLFWKEYDCAMAYCEQLNRRLPNIFFGVKYVEKVDLEPINAV